ncbi:unnamed protein product, partial [Scytosiphon promiscuus]
MAGIGTSNEGGGGGEDLTRVSITEEAADAAADAAATTGISAAGEKEEDGGARAGTITAREVGGGGAKAAVEAARRTAEAAAGKPLDDAEDARTGVEKARSVGDEMTSAAGDAPAVARTWTTGPPVRGPRVLVATAMRWRGGSAAAAAARSDIAMTKPNLTEAERR